MISSYLLWKLLHLIGVIAFLGNITTGLFWAARAHRSHEFAMIASTFSSIIRSDRLFTLPGVFAILIGGFGATIDGQIPVLGTGWILWPIILFSISGIVFGIWVAPLQAKIAGFAKSADGSKLDWQAYKGLFVKWEIWGLVALIAPVAAVVIMVLKPSLPAF